jgi:hypothetical protein
MKTTHVNKQERSNTIPIKKIIPSSMKNASPTGSGEYSLKSHFFDPTKSSPPNDFIIKLHQRMSIYNTPYYSDINEATRESE